MSKLMITIEDPDYESMGDEPTVNVRRLLSRIPDDVVLSVSTRNLVLGDPDTCLCGWAVREEIARTTGVPAESVHPNEQWTYADERCSRLFGGSTQEWNAVFDGVQDARLPVIELAWVERVDKAVRRA